MEFLPTNSVTAPKNLYPCTATITISPSHSHDKNRRQSTSSNNNEDDGNALKRIASGGRRKSDASQRRKSFVSGGDAVAGTGAGMAGMGVKDKGTWYWRVQAGVTDDALVLLPLTQPANPLLTTPPMPLSQAMPAHSSHTPGQKEHHDEGGLIDKMKSLFRGGSSSHASTEKDIPHPDPSATQGGDKVIDQTAGGEQLPSAKANAAGATNVNANAETGWPGVIDGQKLELVAVPLHAIEKGKVGHHGGKKGDAYQITIPINSHFAAMIAGFADSGPQAKSGSIKLEFDKDWIGAKAESELLYHYITSAVEAERNPPSPTKLQLGNQNKTSSGAGAGAAGLAATGVAAAATGDHARSSHNTSSAPITSSNTAAPATGSIGHFGSAEPITTSHTAPEISDRRPPSPTHIPVQNKLPSGYLGETTQSGHGIAGTAVGTGTVAGLDVESPENGIKEPRN